MTNASRARFPRLWDYLDSLPDGIESYPECLSKATLAVSAFNTVDSEELLPDLPEELSRLVQDPPPLGIWVPAVHSDAIFHAVCDRFYPTEKAMKAWCRGRTLRVAKNRLYRAVFRVSSTRALFSMGTRAHGLLQKGTVIEPTRLTNGHALVRMTFPSRLHNEFILLANLPMFEAVAEITGAKHAAAELLRFSETEAHFEVHWD